MPPLRATRFPRRGDVVTDYSSDGTNLQAQLVALNIRVARGEEVAALLRKQCYDRATSGGQDILGHAVHGQSELTSWLKNGGNENGTTKISDVASFDIHQWLSDAGGEGRAPGVIAYLRELAGLTVKGVPTADLGWEARSSASATVPPPRSLCALQPPVAVRGFTAPLNQATRRITRASPSSAGAETPAATSGAGPHAPLPGGSAAAFRLQRHCFRVRYRAELPVLLRRRLTPPFIRGTG